MKYLEVSQRIADKIAALFNGDVSHGASIAAIVDAEIRPLIEGAQRNNSMQIVGVKFPTGRVQ